MEIKTGLKVFQIDLQCDVCGIGKMIFNQQLEPFTYTQGAHNLYRHFCDNPNCSNVQSLPKMYPTIEYEPNVYPDNG